MILLYHSVIPDDSPVERLCVGQALPQSVFEHHIRWLAKRYTIISLADCLNAALEGRYVIESQHSTRAGPIVYGRDFLRMDVAGQGRDPDTGEVLVVHQRGDARAIIRSILDRRPTWRISP